VPPFGEPSTHTNCMANPLSGPHILAVLRQNSIRTTNGAIPCRDGWPVQAIPSPSSAKNLSRRNAHAVYLYI